MCIISWARMDASVMAWHDGASADAFALAWHDDASADASALAWHDASADASALVMTRRVRGRV